MRDLGALPLHEERLLRRWVRAQPQHGSRRALQDFLPKPLLQAWPGLQADLEGLARVASAHPAADGSARLLVALADGQTVEAVLLPPERAQAVCISTQVGCAVGCVQKSWRKWCWRASSWDWRAKCAKWCSWAWASRRTTWKR
jgi:23S rRNA (adenine2503-C2)-methyltransferase